MSYDLIVIGGGVIGLGVARLAARDRRVLLVERGALGREASWAAAGMLSPHTETAGDDALLDLGLAALGMYRRFGAELAEETGIDIEYRDDGVLVLASTSRELERLARQADRLHGAGLEAALLSGAEVRSREPNLTLDLAGALFCPGDHQVRPRRLVEALAASCRVRGVEMIEGAGVDAVVHSGGGVSGIKAGPRRFDAPAVVVAAGAWASTIQGLAPVVEMRPRKGQILSLRMPSPPAFRHVIRWNEIYFVPRADGELIVGATDEDRGFDREVTVDGLARLLEGAGRISRHAGAWPVTETWTGLRPMTSDGLPAIGPAGIDGLFYALGHYRNGILLGPITAEILDAAMRGVEPPETVAPETVRRFAPARFAT